VDTRADGWDVSRGRLGGNDCGLRGDDCGLAWLVGDNCRLAGLLSVDGEHSCYHAERVGLRKQGGLGEWVDRGLHSC
jgi:hypothetical protein